jgi:cysteine sulfinate desulfinase/cysteine desulfurase-like protein
MGVPTEWALGALRCSLGRSTSEDDVDYVLDTLRGAVERIRAVSPAAAVSA